VSKKYFLKGEKYLLRPLTSEDVEGNYRYWLNDPEITLYNSHGRFPRSENYLRNYINTTSSLTDIIVLAIIDSSNDMHVGNISLQCINWVDRSAEIAFLLGDKTYWGTGVMLECGSLLINHAFNSLNLHRVYCGTSSENIGMQKLAVKLGMLQEGVRKEAIFNNGKYYDIIEFGILNLQTISSFPPYGDK
jgi:RimJ/RimL family protein N-acetyltransferase